MPKKKVDSQTGVRFELQDSERDSLKFYTRSAVARNIMQGVGAVAMPAVILFGGITIAAIWSKGYDAIAGDMRTFIQQKQRQSETEWVKEYEGYVQAFEARQESGVGAFEERANLYAFPLLTWAIGAGAPGPDESPLTYEEWRQKTHPDRLINKVNMIGNGMGRLVTFGL